MSSPLPPSSRQPPLAGAAMPAPGASLARRFEARRLGAGAGASWWSEGWRIFVAAPGTWLGITLVLLVIVAVMTAVGTVSLGLVNLAMMILLPVFAGGLMLGCHALARGEPITLGHLFQAFTSPHFSPLVIVGLVSVGASIVAAIVFAIVAALTLGMAGFGVLMSPAAVDAGFSALAGAGVFLLLALLFLTVVMTVVAMFLWFAPALIVLQDATPVEAMGASFRGSMRNLGAFLIFGLLWIGLSIVASIPFFLGWIVLTPMTIGAAYAGWRQIYS
jgi:uncharacterized membrane protein